MTTSLNILHVLMLSAALGCAFFAWREAKGSPVSRRHLLSSPLLAVPVALTLLIFQQSSNHTATGLWTALIVAGLAIGALRGATLQLEVDHTWDLAVLPRSWDASCVAFLMLMVVGFESAAVLAAEDGALFRAVAAAGAVFCVGLFSGRAIALLLRFGHAPQVYLRSV